MAGMNPAMTKGESFSSSQKEEPPTGQREARPDDELRSVSNHKVTGAVAMIWANRKSSR
jgi:hypothetical protein